MHTRPPPCSAPSLTLVGNVTVDIVDGRRVLGGAVSYAAAVASAWGVRACIVTANAADADLSSVFQVREVAVCLPGCRGQSIRL